MVLGRGPVLPGEGGRRTPRRHLPFLLPLAIVSGTSPKRGSTVRRRPSTWPVGTARAALAGSLLESLDAEVDEHAEAAWATEINRRVAELESGAVGTIRWAEVH